MNPGAVEAAGQIHRHSTGGRHSSRKRYSTAAQQHKREAAERDAGTVAQQHSSTGTAAQ